MVRLSDKPGIQKILGIFLRVLFIGGHIIELPWLLIIERFVVMEDRPRLWRIAAHGLNQSIFKIMGLRVYQQGGIPNPIECARVYISNHPTMIDGFLFFSFLGPELIPLTAPAELQKFPFNMWFLKMGVVDVARDAYDVVHCTNTNDRHLALTKLIQYATKEKKSLLIFPEGHVEWGGEAHYIHTGVARIAIRAKIPIVPMALVNMDHIFPGGLRFRPGSVYVHTSSELNAPHLSKKVPYRHAVKMYSQEIADKLYSLMPHRAIPTDLYDKNPERIGVFVDIDRTLYKYYSQQVFLKYLQRHGKVSRFVTWKIISHLLLEKIGLLEHETLMKRAYQFTAGWKESDLAKLAEPFFQEEIIKDMVHNLIVVMKDHGERGHQIFLVSEVIPPLARQFQKFFKARDIAVTTLEKKNGLYTGIVSRLCFNEEKGVQVKRLARKYNIDLQKSYAYGDSPADIPMLKLVRHKIVVRPKPELKHEALLHNWHILH